MLPFSAPVSSGDDLQTGVPSYPSLWRMWNSRCVVSLTGQAADDGQVLRGPTKELIRGSPVPVRARDDDPLPVLDAPPPAGARRFTMDQFQREFGPCLTYSAPASPLRKRFSVESAETIPTHSPAQPSRPLGQDAAAVVDMPARLGTGGWRPVTGRFSLDSSSLPRRVDTAALASARKPLSSLDNLGGHADRATRAVAADESGSCCRVLTTLYIIHVKNVKSFTSHKAHGSALISVSLALSQTPVYTARPRIRG